MDYQKREEYVKREGLKKVIQDDFNNQKVDDISENFVVLNFDIKCVTHHIQKMPEVVADARTKFESEFKPYKKTQKFVFTLQDGN